METKFTKGEWYSKGSLIYCGDKAIGSTFFARNTNETKLDGESWLDMRKRTAEQREIDTKIEPEANAKLFAASPVLFKAVEGFVRDFETDFVMSDGMIVDNPSALLVENYHICKHALKQAV